MVSLLTIGMPWQFAILAGGVGLLAALAAAAALRPRAADERARPRHADRRRRRDPRLCRDRRRPGREQASGIAPIAAGAAIGLGLGGGLYWLAAANGAQAGLARRRAQLHDPGSLHVRRPGAARLLEQALCRDLPDRGPAADRLQPARHSARADRRRHFGRGPGRICPPRHRGGPRRQEIHPRVRAVRRAQDRGQQRAAAERRLGVDA